MGVTSHFLRFGGADGVTTLDRQIVIYGGNVDEIAARDVEAVTVQGRNGVLHMDNGRWSERRQEYLAYLPGANYPARIAYARQTFGRVPKGYQRLEDSYNVDVFSLATFEDALVPESMAFRTSGLCTLAFSCRPERFLRIGEQRIRAEGPVTLVNPSGLPARPLIRVYGTGAGVLYVGGMIVYIDALTDYVDIDSDTGDCFRGSVNCNGDVRIQSFPILEEGTTGISFTGDITAVEITPRWWTL